MSNRVITMDIPAPVCSKCGGRLVTLEERVTAGPQSIHVERRYEFHSCSGIIEITITSNG